MNGWSSGLDVISGKGDDRLHVVAPALEQLTATAGTATGPVVRRH